MQSFYTVHIDKIILPKASKLLKKQSHAIQDFRSINDQKKWSKVDSFPILVTWKFHGGTSLFQTVNSVNFTGANESTI